MRTFIAGLATMIAGIAAASEIYLGSSPSVFPDGSRFAFEWNDDIWVASTAGGEAQRLLTSAGREMWPKVSPDGTRIAFESDRETATRIYVYDFAADKVTALTHHSEYSSPRGWSADGKWVLAASSLDEGDEVSCMRLAAYDAAGTGRRKLFFDAFAREPSLSPDGSKLLFSYRGETDLYRKRRISSSPQAAQIWSYEQASGRFEKLIDDGYEARCPLWAPDGKGFYYLSARKGVRNIYYHPLERGLLSFGGDRALTEFTDEHVSMPSLSADGSTLVFRQGFYFYRLATAKAGERPEKIELTTPPGYQARPSTRRRFYTTCWNNDEGGEVAFCKDGEEMAMVVGGDLFVMSDANTLPRLVHGSSLTHERSCAFSPDGSVLYYVSDRGDGSDLWKAERSNPAKPWVENTEFIKTKLKSDDLRRFQLRVSPKGDRLAWIGVRGMVYAADTNGNVTATSPESTARGGFDWSPDGLNLAVQLYDKYNQSDIYIVSATNSAAWRVSNNFRYEGAPTWSPDGRYIAWAGADPESESDQWVLWFVDLKEGGFDQLSTRVKKTNVKAEYPFFSWDSRTVVFRADGEMRRVSLPSDLKPEKVLAGKVGRICQWVKKEDRVLWMVGERPARTQKIYDFTVRQNTDLADYQELVFRTAWATIRDEFYDPAQHGADWTAVKERLLPYARNAQSMSVFRRVILMMLGELDASHLGFSPNDASRKEWGKRLETDSWHETTVHLGLRFDSEYEGEGWRIKDVIPGTPAANISVLTPGAVVTAIDGVEVGPEVEPAAVLTGPVGRTVSLTVGERVVKVKSISYDSARKALRAKTLDAAREEVHRLSDGRIGYVHIHRMRHPEFLKFQAEIFNEGYGRDALVIDVRGNLGGFTADRLLQVICGADHSLTVPRSTQEGADMTGYLLDYWRRPVWSKPIIVLIDEETVSNGEIFAHAIKTLGRGLLVGRQTSGGVIATRDVSLLDFGTFRKPHIGFYLPDGTNMEHHGATPDIEVDRTPADEATGRDPQLVKAVETLLRQLSK